MPGGQLARLGIGRVGGVLLNWTRDSAIAVDVAIEGSLVRYIRYINKDNNLVDIIASLQDDASDIKVIRRGVAGYTAIQKIVVVKMGRNLTNIAIAPGYLAFGEGIAEHEDARLGIIQRDVADVVITKSQAVGIELIGVTAPAIYGGAIRAKGMLTHRVENSAVHEFRVRIGRQVNAGGASIVKRQKNRQTQRHRDQYQRTFGFVAGLIRRNCLNFGLESGGRCFLRFS